VIANPISGGGRGKVRATQLADALRARGLQATCHFTEAAGDAGARAASAADEDWQTLVAVGGDGTVNEVLNGMPDPSRPLAVLPVGTANVLALELGLPKQPDAAAAAIAAGRCRSMTIGVAGNRRFLLFCGAGVDGAVVHRLHQVRTGTLGKHKWLGPILHTTRHWPQFTLRATFADGRVLDGLSSVLVTRVRNYGGVIQLPHDVDVDSNQLYALCFRIRSRTAWLWQGARGLLRQMQPGHAFELIATTGLRIDGIAPYQLDGDHAGTSPLTIRSEAVKANIIVPEPR
jgi:diacylglycerol kinase family enzyme